MKVVWRRPGIGATSLKRAALAATLLGAIGSLVFMLRAGEHTPRFLLLIFVVWVLAPFVALVVAHVLSKRWAPPIRTTLYAVMLCISLASLAVYADDARGHRRPQAAFVFVLVPPVSCLAIAIALAAAVLTSRTRSRPATRHGSPP